jgi:uncharacterized protein (DUF1697 family)
MNTYIALFRGINVGGSNILPMKLLIVMLKSLGCQNVTTYIQSGNAVFRHEENNAPLLTGKIAAAVNESHGFEPHVILLTADNLKKVMASNPFPDAETDPSKLHLFFLASVPETPDLDVIESIRAKSERFVLKGDIAYLHAPDGIGRSKLAARMERALGVAGTGRNWRSVCRILEMALRCS